MSVVAPEPPVALVRTPATREPRARRKVQARRILTEEAIIEAAEHLFSEKGVDRVSLREIALRAGSANNFAVQYHFGNKEKLIRVLFERRLVPLDIRRGELLAEAQAAGGPIDPRTLMGVMFRPYTEQIDAEGTHSFAAFILSTQYFSASRGLRMEFEDLAPNSQQVLKLLLESEDRMPPDVFLSRLSSAAMAFYNQLLAKPAIHGISRALFLEDAIDVATAAITAPLSPAMRAALEKRKSPPRSRTNQRRPATA